MKIRLLNLLSLLLCSTYLLTAQEVLLEGYTFEDGNRGYLNEVQIQIKDNNTNQIIAETTSDRDGKFSVPIPKGIWKIEATKDLFHPYKSTITVGKTKEFIKVEMQRKPGYIFDVTMAEKAAKNQQKEQVNAIENARIEVYNNTNQKPVLEIDSQPEPNFKVTFERGNHYTLMIRKEGYFTKRLEAYVDVKGCILCFDGVGNVQPGVSDVLTDRNQMGTLLANIELRPIVIDEGFELKNIYYDLNSARLRPEAEKELDALITLLKDNPNISIELGAHTDTRGDDRYNLKLSQKRAQAVVAYLVEKGKIDPSVLVAKGYGETQLVNRCRNGVKCTEEQHQENRRTELKVISINNDNTFADLRLAEIIQLENLSDEIVEIGVDGQITIPDGAAIPEEILKDLQKSQQPPTVVSTNTTVSTTNQIPSPPTTSTKPSFEASPTQVPPKTLPSRKEQPNEPPPAVLIPSSHQPTSETPTTPTNTQTGETIVTQTKQLGKTKQIPNDFTGYHIEFLVANQPLTSDSKIFFRHGNIFLEKKASGEYAYLLGNFKEKKDAVTFLNTVLIKQYPTAKLVYFRNGDRVGYANVIAPKNKTNVPR